MITRSASALLSISVLLSPTSLALAAAQSKAIYTIPASKDLELDMTFELQSPSFTQTGDTAQLSFRLPAVLDGVNGTLFKLSGSAQSNPIELTGTGANAQCKITAQSTLCKIKFDALKLDHVGATQYIDEQGLQGVASELSVGRDAFEKQSTGTISFVQPRLNVVTMK